MSVDQYKTAKARTLATTHQALLKQVRERSTTACRGSACRRRHRLPPAQGAVEEIAIFSVWSFDDQDEDARFAALPPSGAASADVLPLRHDLCGAWPSSSRWWPIPTSRASRWSSVAEAGTGGGGSPSTRRSRSGVHKQTTLGFLAKRVPRGRVHPASQVQRLDGGGRTRGTPRPRSGRIRSSGPFKVANVETPKARGALADRQDTGIGRRPVYHTGRRPAGTADPRDAVHGRAPSSTMTPRSLFQPQHRVRVDHVILPDAVVPRLAEGGHRGIDLLVVGIDVERTSPSASKAIEPHHVPVVGQ